MCVCRVYRYAATRFQHTPQNDAQGVALRVVLVVDVADRVKGVNPAVLPHFSPQFLHLGLQLLDELVEALDCGEGYAGCIASADVLVI